MSHNEGNYEPQRERGLHTLRKRNPYMGCVLARLSTFDLSFNDFHVDNSLCFLNKAESSSDAVTGRR